ncbi:MAG: 23S rRNA (adenine(2503)-C(2))-methyltransferase RlmN [Dehalococcoidia bacterium]|nr:23S rRNA (adenine(2503)-C(2))-methyltransferase RlmN [Dehalococcoidia bacterium]
MYDLDPAALRALLVDWGQPPYRARQAWADAYQRLAPSYDAMTDLPLALRQRLAVELPFPAVEAVRTQRAEDGLTRKALLRLGDGRTIETVLMQYERGDDGRARNTVCLSTQAGCAMGCVFCATGQGGFERNLTPGEIVGQVVHFARILREDGAHITNVVFMGMGEPLANYDATIAAVRTMHDPDGLNIGARHITISTVGLIPGIRRLAKEDLPVTLAVSLHAPNDVLRRRLVPTQRHTMAELLAACRDYFAVTSRRLTFEYALIAGENDSVEQARALGALLRGLPCHVNLIPLNPTPDEHYRRPSRARVIAFQRALDAVGIPCTVRVEKGVEIAAACGQLKGPKLQSAGAIS